MWMLSVVQDLPQLLGICRLRVKRGEQLDKLVNPEPHRQGPSWSWAPTTWRNAARSRSRSSPSTVPFSGTRSPARHSTVVVLPAPLGR